MSRTGYREETKEGRYQRADVHAAESAATWPSIAAVPSRARPSPMTQSAKTTLSSKTTLCVFSGVERRLTDAKTIEKRKQNCDLENESCELEGDEHEPSGYRMCHNSYSQRTISDGKARIVSKRIRRRWGGGRDSQRNKESCIRRTNARYDADEELYIAVEDGEQL